MKGFSAYLRCSLSKYTVKWHFSDTYLSTSLWVRNFGNTLVMRINLFLKMLKINLDVKNAAWNRENGFHFCNNIMWIGCIKFHIRTGEYLASVVNVLTNGHKILHISKTDFFKLNILIRYHQVWQNLRRDDLKYVWPPLPCCLSKGTVKQHL